MNEVRYTIYTRPIVVIYM